MSFLCNFRNSFICFLSVTVNTFPHHFLYSNISVYAPSLVRDQLLQQLYKKENKILVFTPCRCVREAEDS